MFRHGSLKGRMKLFRERFRDWAMGLALFALIFQALIPFAQAIPVDRDGEGGFDSLIICTAWGVKVLQLTTGEEAPVKQTSEQKCPVCSVHNLKLSLPGMDVPAPEPAFRERGERVVPLDHAAPAVAVLVRASIRAPPVSA